MLIVTGGAGFIGSNLVHELNAQGISDILVVDSLANTKKFRNLHGARYVDYSAISVAPFGKTHWARAVSKPSSIREPAPTRSRMMAST